MSVRATSRMSVELNSTSSTAAFGVARSLSGRRWRLLSADTSAVQSLSNAIGVSQALARLLLARGVTPDTAATYLNPALKHHLPEPLSLKDMDKAVGRAQTAVERGEQIAIFGDYDVDGSTSAALLSEFLSAVGAPTRIYIPDRMTEGYGPNERALLQLQADGVSLVITVDCGAGAVAPLQASRAAGLDIIVLDHHAVDIAPPAVAHVNPNQPGDASGLGHVCAAGITFLFVVALNRALRESGWYRTKNIVEPDLFSFVDLVGLATICDVVPLIGLNRAFVRVGLSRLARLDRPGLAALAAVAQVAAPFTPYHLGFIFGPRINAGGRVGRGGLGVDLLSTRVQADAHRYALKLDTHNRERQAIEKLILEEAIALAATQANSPFLFLAAEGWHAGVVGIVAGRLKDRFAKPSFVAGFEGGIGRGSARSIAGIDIGAAVRMAREKKLIESGGGHAMAAGFTLRPEQSEPFRAFLAEIFAKSSDELAAASSVTIDTVVSPAGATVALVEEFARAGPFGAGNSEPLVALADVQIRFADVVGKDHIRLRLGGADGATLDAIAFRTVGTELGKGLLAARGRLVHAVGRLRADEWNGRKRVQLQLEDVALAGA